MLKAQYRLRARKDFQAVYQRKLSYANKYLVLYLKPRSDGHNTRFGYSISHRIGKAHLRNLLKRRLSEITRHHLEQIRTGYDVVIIVRKPLTELSFSEIEHYYLLLLKKAGLYEYHD